MDTSKMRGLKVLAEAAHADLPDWNPDFGLTDPQKDFSMQAGPAVVLALIEEIERLTEEVKLDDKIIAERNRLLDTIPQCAAHGQCVPYAIQWVKDAQTDLAVLREVVDNLKLDNEKMRSFLAEVSRTSGDKWAVMAARNLLKEFGHD